MRLVAMVWLAGALGGLLWGQAADTLGRGTPKAAFLNYLRAAHEGNLRKAAQYLQFEPGASEEEKQEMARKLSFILDRGFEGNFDALEGRAEEDLYVVGQILGLEQSVAVEMVRVPDGAQRVWLVSRETVQAVPVLFPEFGFPWVEKLLPRAFLDAHWLGMPLWVMAAVLAALPLALAAAWGLGWVALRFMPGSWTEATRPSLPVVVLIGLALHSFLSRTLGLPLLYRVWYARGVTVLFLVASVWVIFGLIAGVERRAKAYLLANNLNSTQAALQLGRRLLQTLVLLIAGLVGLRALGYDITAALAGLGIGGIAIAFAAQKTLENVFGGFSMLSDQSIRVGDACQFGTTVATVEEIGLRATRFRTVQRSVLYIPNGQLATMNVENLGQRDKILFKHVIPVKYGLKPDEMEKLLADLTALLEGDERLDAEARRVHLLRFGAYSLEIELFAFVLTNDWVEFLGIQEDLLLKIMRIVDKHGSDFALPSQTLYVEQGQLPFAPEMKAMEAKPEASGPVQGGA